jgi:hypothetical protein
MMISDVSSRRGMPQSPLLQPFPPEEAGSALSPNVSGQERLMSVLGGAVLTYWALQRPSFFRTLAAIAGSSMLSRGLTGHCPVYRACGIDTQTQPARNASYPQLRSEGERAAFQHTVQAKPAQGTEAPEPTSTTATNTTSSTIGEARPSGLATTPHEVAQRPADEESNDLVDEASKESFPASDAPSFTRRPR